MRAKVVLGSLPSERTARHWAQVDTWDDRIREAVDANWEQYHRHVGTQLRTTAPLAVRTLEQVLSGDYPEPKMASAAVRAALAVLDLVGFRKDSLNPEVIAATAARREKEQAVALARGMTPEQIIELEMEEMAAERRAMEAARRGNGGNESVASASETHSADSLR
jgi:hypothetical protein